ncbi:hypothetical protein HZ326_25811 [Fusarium oxysporum f. sp. albedinis]|nr:hypothetical protein HZ326_25811 [Fusarium oxysporum f. sp. albedinis]
MSFLQPQHVVKSATRVWRCNPHTHTRIEPSEWGHKQLSSNGVIWAWSTTRLYGSHLVDMPAPFGIRGRSPCGTRDVGAARIQYKHPAPPIGPC